MLPNRCSLRFNQLPCRFKLSNAPSAITEKASELAKPILSPAKSLTNPTVHGPNAPPIPPNAKRIPRIVPVFATCSFVTAAVTVGNTMDMKNPEIGSKTISDSFPNIPRSTQIELLRIAINTAKRVSTRSTTKAPSNLPSISKTKKLER